MEVLDFLKHSLNPEYILEHGGLYILLLIVFAETGLFFGFFLPGDSLLFIAGLLCADKVPGLDVSIVVLLSSISLAAILGNIVGYLFGYRVGTRLFQRKESVVFKKKYLVMTESFYARYGGSALIIGRFLPILRTFAPILAGVIKMDFKRFMLFNIVGSILWVVTFTLTGYILGKEFPIVREYLEYIIIGLVIVTAVPVIRTVLKERRLMREKKHHPDKAHEDKVNPHPPGA